METISRPEDWLDSLSKLWIQIEYWIYTIYIIVSIYILIF